MSKAGNLRVRVKLANVGVAPFYYRWPVYIAAVRDGRIARRWLTRWRLPLLEPGAPRVLRFEGSVAGLPHGRYTVALGVPNPMPGGHPLRFANEAQDKDIKGWLTLGAVSVG